MTQRTERSRMRKTERKLEEIRQSNRMGYEYKGLSGREKILIEIQKRMNWLNKKGWVVWDEEIKGIRFIRELKGSGMAKKRMGEIIGLSLAWAILVRPYEEMNEMSKKLLKREWRKYYESH